MSAEEKKAVRKEREKKRKENRQRMLERSALLSETKDRRKEAKVNRRLEIQKSLSFGAEPEGDDGAVESLAGAAERVELP